MDVPIIWAFFRVGWAMGIMEGVVTSVVAGATLMAQEATKLFVKDAYTAVRDHLKSRYGFTTLETVEKSPDKASSKAVLEDEVREAAGLAEDADLEAKIKALIAATETAREKALSIGIDVRVIDAARDVVIRNVSGGDVGVRADTIKGGRDVRLDGVRGGAPQGN